MICCFSQEDEDAIENYFKSRYDETSAADKFGEGVGMQDEITQQGLLPGVK